MIQYKSLVQYTRVVDGVRFPQDINEPFLLVYFSENSLFVSDYPKLNIRKPDAKYVVVPRTKIPLTRLVPAMRAAYKQSGLLSFDSNANFPKNKNLIYDTTFFTSTVDKTYQPNTYRQRAGFLIQNMLIKSFQDFPDNYKKILIYSIDVTKPLNTFINRKVFALIKQLKVNEIYFDDMLLVTVDESSARYRQLVKEKDYKFSRVLQYLKTVKIINTEKEQEIEINKATLKVMKQVSPSIDKPDVVKYAVQDYLKKNPKKQKRYKTMNYQKMIWIV